jgi:uncharacterized membrane-anchored protein YhcB (DUF1043 family)
VTPFTQDQWIVVALVFLLGLVVGMILMAGGKWKRRYREEAELRRQEAVRREELEAENRRLSAERIEMDSLRSAAAQDEARRRTDGPGPL